MKRTVLSLFAGLAVLVTQTATAADDLTWQEMASRRDLWPAQCTINTTIPFDGGVTVKAGQKLNVLQVQPDGVQVTTLDGKTTFVAEPGETDALAVARAAYTKLTPKQRALTYAAVVQHKDLWPEHVTSTRSFNLAPGKIVQAGDTLTVVDCQPGGLTVKSEKLNAAFNVVADTTDFMAQARQYVEDPQAGPRFLVMQKQAEDKRLAERKLVEDKQRALGKVVVELEGKLISSVTGKPEPLDAKALPRYLVFMRGSSTCPITRKFAPTLVKYYNDMKPKHPEFEVIWIMTESPADTAAYAKATGFSWRAIEYESTGAIPSVNQPITGKLPQLIVMDRTGKVLANGVQATAPAALQQLDTLLKQPLTP